jgi:hypothetical protein
MTNKFSAAPERSALPFLCALLLTALPYGVASARKRAPRFADYPVREVYIPPSSFRLPLVADVRRII